MGLDELVKKNTAAGRLSFTHSTAEGVEKSDVIFIAVPTPPLADGAVDLSFIEGVARDIAAAMTSYKIIVDKKHRAREDRGKRGGNDQTLLQSKGRVRRRQQPGVFA